MRSNPTTKTMALTFIGKPCTAILRNSSKSIRGVLKACDQNMLVIEDTLKIEPTPAQIEQVLTEAPDAEIRVGEITEMYLIDLDDVICLACTVFDNRKVLKPAPKVELKVVPTEVPPPAKTGGDAVPA